MAGKVLPLELRLKKQIPISWIGDVRCGETAEPTARPPQPPARPDPNPNAGRVVDTRGNPASRAPKGYREKDF